MATIGAMTCTRMPSSLCNSIPKHRCFSPSLQPPKAIQNFHSFNNFRPSIFHSLAFKVPANGSVDFFQTTSADANVSKNLQSFEPIRVIGLFLLWLCLSFVLACEAAYATNDSIRASSFGLRIASVLRGSGWADEAIVFALATLPVLELRGAIPVGYWMQLKPLQITVLSVLGNMVPVPIIVLYLKRFASFLARRNASASRFLDLLFKNAKEKAGPIEEFQWLGLMLFVAVPFPGTGAWTGAIIALILDMPFWSAISANFVGVVLAGLLVNLLVNLGLKYAIVTGFILFFISTVMWSFLRNIKKSMNLN